MLILLDSGGRIQVVGGAATGTGALHSGADDPMLARIASDPSGFPWPDLRAGRQTPVLPVVS